MAAPESQSAPKPVRKSRRHRRAAALLVLAALALFACWAGRGALVNYCLARARRAMADLDLEGARAWLQAAQRRQPERAEIHYLLGVVNRRAARYRPAKECFERAGRLGWFQKDLERQRIMLTFQVGYVQKAESYLNQLFDRDCSDEMTEDVYEAMVMGYLAEFRVNEGMTCLDYWVRWRPESVRARIWRAQFYDSMLDQEKVRAELGEVLRIDARRVHERLWLAQSLLDANQAERALAECEIAGRQAPGDPRVSLMLGLCHFKQGRQDEARRELESALAGGLDARGRLQGLVILGHLASASRDHELAARHYKEAVKAAPGDSAAHYAL